MQRPIIFANGNVKLAKAPTKHEYAREVAHREGVPTVYELAAIHDGARSFYHKAHVVEVSGGYRLYSYGTRIATATADGLELTAYWDYGPTTSRHLAEFIAQVYGSTGYRKTALRALGAVDSCSCTIPASAFAA